MNEKPSCLLESQSCCMRRTV